MENFLSQIRRKERYPSLWQYAVVYNRAYMGLCKLSVDHYILGTVTTRKLD